MNPISVESVENFGFFNFETVAFLLRLGQLFGIFRAAGKRHNLLWCSVSGFVAVDPIDVFSASLGSVFRASAANCTYIGRIKLLRALFR